MLNFLFVFADHATVRDVAIFRDSFSVSSILAISELSERVSSRISCNAQAGLKYMLLFIMCDIVKSH